MFASKDINLESMVIDQSTTMRVQREISKKKVAVKDKISGEKNGHGLDKFPFLAYSCTLFIYLFIYTGYEHQ